MLKPTGLLFPQLPHFHVSVFLSLPLLVEVEEDDVADVSAGEPVLFVDELSLVELMMLTGSELVFEDCWRW